MIVIQKEKDLLRASVIGRFQLADFREFEEAVTTRDGQAKPVNLLLDLRSMEGFTVDVAWEDIRFTRAHPHDFARIAIIADSQWSSWIGWLGAAFTDAAVETFAHPAAAEQWARTG
jgi:hypothetical protein